MDLNSFYLRRYKKILPFFALLIAIDVLIDRSLSHLIEGVTELTLIFGLLPNNQLDVIGVSWTIGVIFLFYLLFPFFVFMCWSKRRAIFCLIVSIVLNLFCSNYFFTESFVIESFVPRHCFIYCIPYFLAGGVCYLFREEIKSFVSKHRWLCLAICLLITSAFYIVGLDLIELDDPGPWLLPIFFLWLAYAISVKSKILSNRVMKYLGGISLEMYLAQMLIFRIIDKAGGLYLLGAGVIGFVVVCIVVLVGLLLFISVYRGIVNKCKMNIEEKRL